MTPVNYEATHVSRHPFAASLSMDRITDFRTQTFRSLSWRVRLSWRLLRLAERVGGADFGMTIVVNGSIPARCDLRDFLSALDGGLTYAQQYLADLSRDRAVR